MKLVNLLDASKLPELTRQAAPWNLAHTTPGGPVPEGVWQHLVATYDGTNIALFLNGKPVGNAEKPGFPGRPKKACNSALGFGSTPPPPPSSPPPLPPPLYIYT